MRWQAVMANWHLRTPPRICYRCRSTVTRRRSPRCASVGATGELRESSACAAPRRIRAPQNRRAVAHLRDDARDTFLGRAATALADATSPQNAIARQQVDSATSQMLAQQARLGLDWAMDQTINVNLPVRLPSGDAEVNLSVARDRDPDAGS